jgi:hypothetical protein
MVSSCRLNVIVKRKKRRNMQIGWNGARTLHTPQQEAPNTVQAQERGEERQLIRKQKKCERRSECRADKGVGSDYNKQRDFAGTHQQKS